LATTEHRASGYSGMFSGCVDDIGMGFGKAVQFDKNLETIVYIGSNYCTNDMRMMGCHCTTCFQPLPILLQV